MRGSESDRMCRVSASLTPRFKCVDRLGRRRLAVLLVGALLTAAPAVLADPVIVLAGAGHTAAYSEAGSPATIEGGVTVSDSASTTLSGATATVSAGFFAGDLLAATTLGSITASYDTSTGVLTLSGTDTLANYQTVLNTVAFSSSSQNPTNFGADTNRTISWVLNDGTHTGAEAFAPFSDNFADLSNWTTTSGRVSVTGSTLYLSSGDVTSKVTTTGTFIGSLRITMKLNVPGTGDRFVVTHGTDTLVTLTGGGNITRGVAHYVEIDLDSSGTAKTYIEGTLTATQSGLGTGSGAIGLSDYGAGASQTTNFLVTDLAWTSTVSVTGVDNAPALAGAGGPISYTVQGTASVIAAAITASDVDNANLSGGTVSISSGFFTGDRLNFTNQNGISGSYNSTTGVLTLSGSSTIAHYQTALQSVTFDSTSANPTNAGTDTSRTVAFVVSDGTLSSASASVSVTINRATPAITTAPSATPISYGQTLASSTLSGGVASTAGTFAFTTPGTAPGIGTAAQGVTFTPTDVSNYTTATTTASVTVGKATPTITTAPSATAITYGQTLASSTLSGGVASTAGTFAFTNPATAPGGGTASQGVTFTPTDGTNYTTATTTARVTVSKVSPTITWTTPLAILYGTPLSAAQLNATASVPGTFTYSPASGTILDAAAQTLAVSFVPSDLADYNTATASVSLAVAKAPATLTVGNLTQTYDGSAKPVSVQTTPAGLSMSVIYVGVTGTPVNPGQYIVRVSVLDSNYWAAATATMTINPASQTISFPAVGALVGVPVSLVATASSGLPVTLTLVSGNATLTGSTLTIKDSNPVVVQASQAGNGNYAAAPSVTQTIGAQLAKQSQTITFVQPADQKSNAPSFSLQATASSGLPVAFTVLSGPALLAGSTVTLSGAVGTVSVQASQPGNSLYNAAPSVTVTFKVLSAATQIYFGTVSGGVNAGASREGLRAEATGQATSLAGYVSPDGSSGTLIGYLSGPGEGFVVSFSPDSSGNFTTTTTALPSTGGAGPTLTFVGRVSASAITGTIVELGASFSAALDPVSGPSAGIAGYYRGASLKSASGTTYSVVGTQGEVYVLAITPTMVVSGTGTVGSNNSFSISATQSATVTGAIDPATTTVTGSITSGAGAITSYSGLATTTTRTDRLVNLSALALVGTGQRVLMAGLVIAGPDPKPVLLRGVGPTLAGVGVSGVLANPVLVLLDSSGNL